MTQTTPQPMIPSPSGGVTSHGGLTKPEPAPVGHGPARYEVETVDPAKAARMLRRVKNRPIKPALVERYAAEMKRGAWVAGGTDAIAVDRNGFLRNGQHRLWAVIQSGTTLQMLVARNVNPEAFKTMDVGATRQPGDLLGIAADDTGDRSLGAGLRSADYKNAAAAVRLLERLEQRPHFPITGTWNLNERMSPAEISDAFLGKWAKPILAVLPDAKRLSGAGILGGSGIWTSMLVLMDRIAPEDRQEFVRQVATGANLSPGSATLALRNRLLRGSAAPGVISRAAGAYAERTNLYARSIAYAWNAFRDGRDITRLSVNLDRPFPYPR